MKRINLSDLESLVNRINLATSSPLSTYTRVGMETKANLGNYHLDSAYGGHKLVRIVSDGGGVKEVTYGFVSKRELYGKMQAFLSGIDAGCSK